MASIEPAIHRSAVVPPRGAAISGVVFAVLTIIGLGLVRYAVPNDLRNPGVWMIEPEHKRAILFAVALVPFAGIAFLWFIGVLRNRLAELEDQFFSTIFLGSGLLFIATLFAAATVTDALIRSVADGNMDGELYNFGRSISDVLLNLFAMKMAGVFMFSTCTIALRTEIFPRWVAFIGYLSAILLLVIIANWKWIALVFPAWMLILSGHILLAEFRSRHLSAASSL